MLPRWALLLAVLAALLPLGGVAAATTTAPKLDAVVAALRADPVYNDPAAPQALSPAEANQLRDQIRASGEPIRIAVLPQSVAAAAGSPDNVVTALGRSLGGVVAVVVGTAFRAGPSNAVVTEAADNAFNDHRPDTFAVLSGFVSNIDDAGAAAAAGGTSRGVGWGGLIVLLVIVAVVAVVAYLLLRRARRISAARLAEVRAVVDEDVTEFGERLAGLDLNDPRLDDAGRADLATALTAYDRSKFAVAAMRRPQDAAAVTTALEDGRYAVSCVTARLAGEPAPERRPPCFFDPRHGPSTEDVSWAPDGGAPRPVPACRACAIAVAEGMLPAAREVPAGVDGERVPYWQAGRQYAPYAGGYFASFGNVLPALMIGTMMGSMFHSPVVINNVDNGGGDAAGNDGGWGGGDWGGGSGGFGGGDLGGGGGWGDFGGGGGDFGGGDFGGN